MILLSEEYSSNEGVQIHFDNMQQIVIQETNDRKRISGSPVFQKPNGDLPLYSRVQIWILFENGRYYISTSLNY